MDEFRKKRYHDKINYIAINLKDLSIKPKNELERRGIFYSLQTSIEAVIDLVAMLVKDLGFQVNDDSYNISKIVQIKKIDPKLEENLRKAKGLRNILVYRYNNVDENLILSSIDDLKQLLYDWLEIIEEILDEIS
ncbi:MAG: DUF86 domain-containing protein [Promethearchaeota archaeon]